MSFFITRLTLVQFHCLVFHISILTSVLCIIALRHLVGLVEANR